MAQDGGKSRPFADAWIFAMSNIQRTERMLDKTRWIFYQAKRE